MNLSNPHFKDYEFMITVTLYIEIQNMQAIMRSQGFGILKVCDLFTVIYSQMSAKMHFPLGYVAKI